MGRKKIPPEIVDYARTLYLTLDENGKRIYSYRKIAEKISAKFQTKISDVTIKNWADKHNWHRLLSQAIVVSACDDSKREIEGVVTQIIEKEKELPVDEELIEKLALAKRTVLVNHLKMAKKLYQAVEEKDPNDKRFARLCEVANQVGKAIYEMLSDVEEAKEEAETFPAKIIIREIRLERN